MEFDDFNDAVIGMATFYDDYNADEQQACSFTSNLQRHKPTTSDELYFDDDGKENFDECLDDAILKKSDFQGCYCLVSQSENKFYKNRTYIGYTVNPARRIKQHNKGINAGGAKRTNCRGPWDMVIIIHGFMHPRDALRFEWAWQNPTKSRRVKHLEVKKKGKKESIFAHQYRVALLMLSSPPWSKMPLTIRWLLPHYRLPHPINTPTLPSHIDVKEGLPDHTNPFVDYGPLLRKVTDATVLCICCSALVETWRQIVVICTSCPIIAHWRCAWNLVDGSEDELRSPNATILCAMCNVNNAWHMLVRRTRHLHNLCEKHDLDKMKIANTLLVR